MEAMESSWSATAAASGWAKIVRIAAATTSAEPLGTLANTLRKKWTSCRIRHEIHKVANCLNALPKSVQPTAKRMLAEIRDAEDRELAIRAIDAFAGEFAAKWPKAVAKIVDDAETLLAFFAFPAEHWIHLKTTNPIESTFATVRLRTKVTKGPGSRAAGLAMAFTLIEAAEQRWRSVNAPHLVALVRAGTSFDKGVMVERPKQQDQEAAA